MARLTRPGHTLNRKEDAVTDRQIKGSAEPPSRGQVIEKIVTALLSCAVYVAMFWGEGLYAVVGLLGWALISISAVTRAAGAWSARRHILRVQAADRLANTGTWSEVGGAGGSFTVRWDAWAGWWVQGFLGEHQHEPHERLVSADEATALVAAAEQSGDYVRADDEGTVNVRARLGLTGWDEYRAGDLVPDWPIGGPRGDLYDEPAVNLTQYRHVFKPGPY